MHITTGNMIQFPDVKASLNISASTVYVTYEEDKHQVDLDLD